MDAITIRANGVAEMAFTGDRNEIWHRLGNQMEGNESLESWIARAGLDWRVCRSRVRYGEGANQRVINSKYVLFRSDTKDDLGIVSDKYVVTHPSESIEFFRDLLPEGYRLSTAGSLFGGRKWWALASVGEAAVVVGMDKIQPFLLFCSSADGSTRTTAKFVTIRTVCDNTLQMGLSERTNQVAISHRSQVDMKEMKQRLGLATGEFATFMKNARKLASTPVTQDQVDQFLGDLLIDNKMVTKKDVTKSRPFVTIKELFDGDGKGSTLDGVDGTLWGLLNAVTEYTDHKARAQDDANRIDSALFGRGDALKTDAMRRALVLAG